MPKPRESRVIPLESVALSILILREQRVLMDANLAGLYGVPTKRFNEAIKRNRARFPADFAFQLTLEEFIRLKSSEKLPTTQPIDKKEEKEMWSQFATTSADRRRITHLPWAFTEHGAIMAASVLNSPRAVQVSVYVVRAFVRMRELLASDKDLARRLEESECQFREIVSKHGQKLESHEQALAGIFKALHELMNPPRVHAIGFTANFDKKT